MLFDEIDSISPSFLAFIDDQNNQQSGKYKCLDCCSPFYSTDLPMEDGQKVQICTRKMKGEYQRSLLKLEMKQLKQLHEMKESLELEKRNSECFFEKKLLECHREITHLNESLDLKILQYKELQKEKEEAIKCKNELANELRELKERQTQLVKDAALRDGKRLKVSINRLSD